MDLNGMPAEGFADSPVGIPYGLGMLIAGNETFRNGYESLTETEREHLIFRCKDAQSEEELRRIIRESVPEGNVNNLIERNQLKG